MTVRTTFAGTSLVLTSPPPRSYHVDRVRKADGTWTLTLLLPPPPTLYTTAAGVRVPAGPDIARIEIDDVGAAPRFFLRSGAPLALASVAELQRGGIDVLGSLPADLQGRTRQLLAGGPTSTAPSSGLARLLSTAQSRAKLRSALAASYRAAGRSAAGGERFARVAADTTLELTLDPAVGNVADARVVVANREVAHMGYTFAQVAPNVYARSKLQLTRDLGAGRGTASTEVVYRNITLR